MLSCDSCLGLGAIALTQLLGRQGLLGAGEIGMMFPPENPKIKGIKSADIVAAVSSVGLLLLIWLILRFSGNRGLQTSIEKSNYKYATCSIYRKRLYG